MPLIKPLCQPQSKTRPLNIRIQLVCTYLPRSPTSPRFLICSPYRTPHVTCSSLLSVILFFPTHTLTQFRYSHLISFFFAFSVSRLSPLSPQPKPELPSPLFQHQLASFQIDHFSFLIYRRHLLLIFLHPSPF